MLPGRGVIDGFRPADEAFLTMTAISRRAKLDRVVPVRYQIDRAALQGQFAAVRTASERLVAPLEPEDMVVQSMPDASPTKWHLAHMTWFFETFFLQHAQPEAADHHPSFNYLFNSYYNAVGAQFPRFARGLVTRPTVVEVFAYRRTIDERVADFLAGCDEDELARFAPIVELGIHHEQQHQELLLTDIKHLLAQNPLRPVYTHLPLAAAPIAPAKPSWVTFAGGVVDIGHDGKGFAYDNEGPRHAALLAPYELSSRTVTCGEWLDFIADGGYRKPILWLADGWATCQREGWAAPLYWEHDAAGSWSAFTLGGVRSVVPEEPVCHVSYYEADAFARWAGARLPSEFEWETASRGAPVTGNFVETGSMHPRPGPADNGIQQLYGDVWEWTASPYIGYPGYRPAEGAVGEYNGKFMCNQLVLRGGSVATPSSHMRATYRNFFYPLSRWQFMGLRLARDAG